MTSKLHFPSPRASLVPRPRLIKRLQTGLQGPLTLISAPAGSGKTTLYSQWRLGPGSGIPASWLSLDPADNDLRRFLQYLSAALDILKPGLEEVVRLQLQSAELPNGEAVLTAIINHLGSLEEESVLALDDLHLIDNPVIHTDLTFLLDHLPPRLHLVILSRADPPLPLARLRARGQLVELRSADLRFSVEECAQFLNQVMGLGLTGEQVAALEKRTEGWIAGLQLAALSMQDREDRQKFISAFTGNNHYIVDYLIEEVLQRQPEPLRQFLLRTSILDRMTGPLCDSLTGEQDGEEILKHLERANLFIIPLDDEHLWYRYHHLFSDLLRLRLAKIHPGLSAELHQRACRWYEAQDMLSEALQHAIASGDMKLVAQIISSNVLVLMETNEVLPILEKIDSLPADQLDSLPLLAITRAWNLGTRQAKHPHEILNRVERNLVNVPSEKERQEMKGLIAAARAYLFESQGDMDNALVQVRLADEWLPEEAVAERSMNLIMWGDVLADIQDDPNAMPILEKALELALQVRKPMIAVIAMSAIANAHNHAGRYHDLHRVCLEALAFTKDYESRFRQPLSANAEIYGLLGRVYAEWGENEKAVHYTQKGVSLSERWGLVFVQSICLSHLGRALALSNDWGQARPVFQRADDAAAKVSPWYLQVSRIFTLESMLDCETTPPGEIAAMRHLLPESESSYPPALKARLSLRDGHPEKALALMDAALVELKGHISLDHVRFLSLRALALQAMGEDKKALTSLRQALELAEPENRVATFVREGPAMEKLLRLAGSKSDAPQFVRRVLAAFEARRRPRQSTAIPGGGLVEPLSRRELEVLKLLAQGNSDKQIAETLVIARETVHKHLKNIYGKLGVHSRTEAIAHSRELGLL